MFAHHHRFPPEAFGGRGRARGRAAEALPPIDRTEVAGWFAGRLPDEWFTGPVELVIDRDEITVVGAVPEPDAGDGDPAAARAGRCSRAGRRPTSAAASSAPHRSPTCPL